MQWPTAFNFVLIPLIAIAITGVVAVEYVWVNSADTATALQPQPSEELKESTLPAQHAQSAPAVFNPASVVRLAHHGPNHPPVMNSPGRDRSRVVLFPSGPGTALEFEGDPASDYEEDIVTYRFGVAIPGRLGIRAPEEALLCVDRYGSRFFIRPRSSVTPDEFASVYGNVGTVPVLPVVIYASDGKSESKPVLFNLTLVYDASFGSSSPSKSMGGHPGETSEPVERSEGASDSVRGMYAKLRKVTDVSRVWRLDPPSLWTGSVRSINPAR